MIPKFADADAHDVDRFLKQLQVLQSNMHVFVTGNVTVTCVNIGLGILLQIYISEGKT